MENDFYAGAFSLIEAMKNALVDNVSDSLQSTRNIEISLSDVISATSILTGEEFANSAQEVITVVAAALDRVAELCVNTSAADDFIMLDKETVEVLQGVTPFVSEEKREEFQKVVEPSQSKKSKMLSAENVRWLLGIIISTLVSFYFYQLSSRSEETHLQLHKEGNSIEQHESESIDELIDFLENFFDGVENNGIDVNLNINISWNPINEAADGIDVSENRTDIAGELDALESKYDDEQGQGDVPGQQP